LAFKIFTYVKQQLTEPQTTIRVINMQCQHRALKEIAHQLETGEFGLIINVSQLTDMIFSPRRMCRKMASIDSDIRAPYELKGFLPHINITASKASCKQTFPSCISHVL